MKRAPAHAPARRWWLCHFDLVFLVIGLALLSWMLSRQPLSDIYDAVVRMGPIAFVTPLIALAWFPTHATALWVLLDARPPWSEVLYNRLVGDGYNALLPMAGLGGEPFKARHLSRFIPIDRAVTALVRDRVIDNAIGFLFSAACVAVTLPRFALPTVLRDALWAYAAIAGALGALSFWLVISRLPGRLGKLLGRCLSGSAEEPPTLPLGRALLAAAWSMASRVLGVCEIAVLLHAIDAPVDLATAVFVDSALNAAGFIGFAFPQGIGVFEGSSVYLLGCLGVSAPAALAFALVRRGRMLVVSLLGVALHLARKTQPVVTEVRPLNYPPGNLPHVTAHTLSYLRAALEPSWSVLDVGCGEGWVCAELALEGREVVGVDIVDVRKTELAAFQLWNGVLLPFPDESFDVVALVFVLHHVPNQLKPGLLREARRVARQRVFILEDTPRTPLDWLAGWMHGHRHRRQIGSTADFGFYTQREWERLCPEHGLAIGRSTRVPRFERLWWRPWARSAFVLDKVAEADEPAACTVAGDRRARPAAERVAAAPGLRVADPE
jgi:SAM-dependent methyltransferase